MQNEKLKILAIINPISGTSKKEYVPETISRIIDSSTFDTTICFSERPGHATQLTKEAIAKNFYAVIAIGGDGTINEVASALRDSNTALGIIPCGSGNGLARHLNIPINIENALEIINENNVETFDYCTANNQPFFCTCGVGFDAHVSEKFAQARRRGPLTYIQQSLIEYLKYSSKVYHIEANNKTITEKAFLIACGNASQYGNNAFITPQASMKDGLIDVTVILPFTPLDTAMMGILLFTKHLDQDTNIQSFQTEELTIKRPTAGTMHLDGDPVMMEADIKVVCHKAGIKIFVPTEVPDKKSILAPIEDYFWQFIKSIRSELNI